MASRADPSRRRAARESVRKAQPQLGQAPDVTPAADPYRGLPPEQESAFGNSPAGRAYGAVDDYLSEKDPWSNASMGGMLELGTLLGGGAPKKAATLGSSLGQGRAAKVTGAKGKADRYDNVHALPESDPVEKEFLGKLEDRYNKPSKPRSYDEPSWTERRKADMEQAEIKKMEAGLEETRKKIAILEAELEEIDRVKTTSRKSLEKRAADLKKERVALDLKKDEEFWIRDFGNPEGPAKSVGSSLGKGRAPVVDGPPPKAGGGFHKELDDGLRDARAYDPERVRTKGVGRHGLDSPRGGMDPGRRTQVGDELDVANNPDVDMDDLVRGTGYDPPEDLLSDRKAYQKAYEDQIGEITGKPATSGTRKLGKIITGKPKPRPVVKTRPVEDLTPDELLQHYDMLPEKGYVPVSKLAGEMRSRGKRRTTAPDDPGADEMWRVLDRTEQIELQIMDNEFMGFPMEENLSPEDLALILEYGVPEGGGGGILGEKTKVLLEYLLSKKGKTFH